MTWKDELKRLKLDSIKESTPQAFEASGGYTMSITPYKDNSANGLTKCIVDFLTFKGHYSNRINTQGQARVSDIPRFDIFQGKMVSIGKNVSYTKSTTKKGTPDIDAIIQGKPVKIEVKVGKDYMKKEQKAERAKIEKAGGYYFIAKDMQTFYNWYYETFPNL